LQPFFRGRTIIHGVTAEAPAGVHLGKIGQRAGHFLAQRFGRRRGSLRGLTYNLAAAVGTAVVGALLGGILSSIILGNLAENPVITAELKDEVNLTDLNFFRDAQLKERLAGKNRHAGAVGRGVGHQRRGPDPGAQDRLPGAVRAGAVGDLPVQLAAGSQAR
jgi:hypothetical protein